MNHAGTASRQAARGIAGGVRGESLAPRAWGSLRPLWLSQFILWGGSLPKSLHLNLYCRTTQGRRHATNSGSGPPSWLAGGTDTKPYVLAPMEGLPRRNPVPGEGSRVGRNGNTTTERG